MPARLIRRRLLEVATARMAEEAVVVLQGPRTVGKSVLLAELAKMAGVEVIDLDDPSTAEAVSADPALVAGSAAPVCIDEYQHAPELLGAIKSELNRGLRPGRFVLTGSTRSEAVPELARYLAGRVHLLSVLPFFPGRARWNPGGSAGGASPWRFH